MSDSRIVRTVTTAGLWTLVVLAYAAGLAAPIGPGQGSRALQFALAVWLAWVLLFPFIVWADRLIPSLREALAQRVLLHGALGLLFAAAFGPVFRVTSSLFGVSRGVEVEPWSAWVLYWMIASGYLVFDYHDQIQQRTARASELERLLAQSRIETLRTQLNPHFLFNALNAISAHVEGAPRTARWMLEQLGDLLRLSLDHADEQEIPLQRELAFIDRYLKLQKIRFDNRLDVIVDVEPTALRALVPTFILQPLLENAIQHGIARRSAAGLIEIQAWHENGALHLSVRDDGPGLPEDWDPDRGLGVGLSNTRERLRRLYADDQRFEIASIEGSGVRVDLTLPYRESHGA